MYPTPKLTASVTYLQNYTIFCTQRENVYKINRRCWHLVLDCCVVQALQSNTLNSAYNEVAFNEKSAITKENLCTKYTPFTYKYIILNKKLPITKQNLCIIFFIIDRVECSSNCLVLIMHRQLGSYLLDIRESCGQTA